MVALRQGYDLVEEVRSLKRQHNAMILAHNYQAPEILHVEFTSNGINRIREQYPTVAAVGYAECASAVGALADETCSTEGMASYGRQAPADTRRALQHLQPEIVLGTEVRRWAERPILGTLELSR